ncbi:MAG: UDP-N-acetylmuramoyl-L-alanyl-D-glutamate--2,6-diaminopimelate ligase [Cytophagales bacterium]|nr:UDP-N-acetylmuramoyl-L-alanyl-D-glutamate--2,6-diaminopimelate ligase [Cytophagales bacterium]
MANLKDILYSVGLVAIEGNRDMVISGLAFDSRQVKEGFLFVAIRGLTVDGHNFIDQSIAAGAIAIVCEELPQEMKEGVTYVQSNDSSKALGVIADNYYDHPSTKLKLIGVTGTNGKTTTATLLYDLFQHLGYKAGLLSTVENKIDGLVLPSSFTTPDALQLNELLHDMVEKGVTHCFMEVSSHALIQGRVEAIDFAGGVFTNISHDHLDYHKTFDNYIAAKKLLFDGLSKRAFALTNVDDKRGMVMLQNTRASKYTYGIKSVADYKGKILSDSLQGLQLNLDDREVWCRLIGKFNAYNLLVAYAVAVELGEDADAILAALSSLDSARGRFEQVPNGQGVTAIVDYAHTPDALENVLNTITGVRTRNETLITVVGCGGDRDKEKRPEMARIATKFSDKVILTSDNPRTEDPELILVDMMQGVPKSEERKTMKVTDRKEAIRVACNLATEQDIILVAGKGHENYQEINGERMPFDDKEILNQILNDQ